MLLEFEVGLGYLGMELIPTTRGYQIAYLVPGYSDIEEGTQHSEVLFKSLWRYRTSRSAGSARGLLVGFLSRIHNAARYAYPLSRAREAVAQLVTIALLTGQCKDLLATAVKIFSMRYPHVFSKSFALQLTQAIRLPSQKAVRACRRIVGMARREAIGLM